MKKVLHIGVFVLLFSLSFTNVFSQKTVQDYYIEAELAKKKNSYQLALSNYELAIQNDSSNVKYHSAKAVLYIKMQRYDDAIKTLKNCTVIKPDYISAYILTARLYEKMSNVQNNDSAIKYFNIAFKKEKSINRKVAHLISITKILLRTEKPENAKTYIIKAKSLAPNNAKVLILEADFYAFNGKYQDALNLYKSGIKLLKDSPIKEVFYYKAGIAAKVLGRTELQQTYFGKITQQKFKELIQDEKFDFFAGIRLPLNKEDPEYQAMNEKVKDSDNDDENNFEDDVYDQNLDDFEQEDDLDLRDSDF